MTRDQEILALAATGADPVTIACELLCDVRIVARVLAMKRPGMPPVNSAPSPVALRAAARRSSRSLSDQMQDVLAYLASIAERDALCPTNTQIGGACGLPHNGQVVRALGSLRAQRLITIEKAGSSRNAARIVTITATGAKTTDPRNKLPTGGATGGQPRLKVETRAKAAIAHVPEVGRASVRERPAREPTQSPPTLAGLRVDVTAGETAPYFMLESGCRWIDGDLREGDAHQCRERQLPSKPYCAAHCARAYDRAATARCAAVVKLTALAKRYA